MASPERRLGLLELGVLVAVAALALLFHLTLPRRSPDEASYRAVAEVLSREAKPGDVLLLFPWWTERARLFVPEGLPVVGYLGSDADPLERHPRIWVLGQPGLPRSGEGDFERAFLPGRTAVGTPRDFGPLRLSLHRNGRHRPTLFSSVDAFASASVYLEGGNGVRLPCPFDGQAFRCPGGETRVAPEWHELKAQPRRCLWFAPPGGNRRLVAEFSQVPAGARLVLEGGLIWDRGWHHGPQLTPTRFGVEDVRTGRSLLRVDVPVGMEGLQRAEIAPEGGGPLALRIWSQSDRAELRELCLELLSQGPEGAP